MGMMRGKTKLQETAVKSSELGKLTFILDHKHRQQKIEGRGAKRKKQQGAVGSL